MRITAPPRRVKGAQGQAVIEFTLALLVVLLLFSGTVAVWTWMSRSLIWRQQKFDDTRKWNANINDNSGAKPDLTYYSPEPLVNE